MKNFIILFISLHVLQSSVQGSENCKCVDEWTSTLPKRIKAFKDPPTTDKYEYLGVIVGAMDAFFKPCICTDVVRMGMTITVDNADLYSLASSSSSGAALNLSVAISNMFPAMEALKTELQYRFESVQATYVSITAPSKSTYNLDFILRGTNTTTVPNLVPEALVDPAVTIVDYPGAVTYNTPTVTECTGTPPDSPNPSTITRQWNGDIIPPTEVTYECPAGEYVTPLGAGKVNCQHESLTWTTLEEIQCQSGCGELPPEPPINCVNDWDSATRAIDTEITYYCKYGYGSGDGKNTTSTCGTDGWTKLAETYYCKEKPCLDDIPQVPAHASTNFYLKKRKAGEDVTYVCHPGYVASTKVNKVVSCRLGLWNDTNPTWKCININALSLAEQIKGDIDLDEIELTAEEKERKIAMIDEPNYFVLVTIPSIIVLMFAMLICLCCTKINSPLFYICRGYAGSSSSDDYMSNFGKNQKISSY